MEVTIARHCVGQDPVTGLSPMQTELLAHSAPVRIVSAPTGSGKSYAFKQAMLKDQRVLFIVPTRRLAQNLVAGLREDLVTQDGWGESQAEDKVTMWSSDATQQLREKGEVDIGARRCREIFNQDDTRTGGEMIVAIAEVVVGLLLRRWLRAGLSSVGILDIAESFDHVVFDEFHTICARGFGLAAVCALLAAQWPGARMKVSFLSATPLEIAPVLEKVGVGPDTVTYIDEPLQSCGRVVHGDVRLTLCERSSMVELVRDYLDEVTAQVQAGQTVVMIFDELRALLDQTASLSRLLQDAGVRPGQALVINSLDDSRQGPKDQAFFHWGRQRDPRPYKVIAATSSVEMGVTFRSNLLFMEPGFFPMNFLQRYGRAARGHVDGHVVVRSNNSRNRLWLKQLHTFVADHQNEVISIDQLTSVLAKAVRKAFTYRENTFGSLPNRAAYAAGLFWHALIEHPSMKGYQAGHLKQLQPGPAKSVRALLFTVRKMGKDPVLGRHAETWCRRFEDQVRQLRDIGPRICICEPDGSRFEVLEDWLERNTHILTQYPVVEGKNRLPEIHLVKAFHSYLLDKKNKVKRQVEACFPHTGYTARLEAGPELVAHWCREFKNPRSISDAWQNWPESMAAAMQLVQQTGLVVCDENVALEASTHVL